MELFAWILEDEGYAFQGVRCGEDGLTALDQEDFDLVIMDIALPGIDGMEATRRIRALSRFARLPIIAVTAHASRRDNDEILASGVTLVVTKPVEHGRLLQAVECCLLEGTSNA
jgi:CheY-like chemotaxis protein